MARSRAPRPAGKTGLVPGQAAPAAPDGAGAARSANHDPLPHRALLEQAEVAAGLGWWIVELRRNGQITASAHMLRMLGLAVRGFDGMTSTLRALLHPEDAARVSAVTARTLQDGTPFQVEHRIVRPDGAVRWLRQSAIAERDEAGAPVRMLGICQDITDRKQAEEEIRAVGAYNRSLIEASLDPMLVVDREAKITDLNEVASQVSGYTRDEVVGTDFGQYFTEPAAASVYEQVFRTGSLRDFSLGLRHRDGHVTPLLCSAVVYRDPNGRPLGVLAFGHDVTETKRAESALRESRERLSAVFDNAPVGIDDLTPDGQIVRVNPRFCQITGYTADELRSMPVQDVIHPDDRDADLAKMRLLLGGEIDHYSMERRYVRKNGDVVWAEVNRAIVRDDGGKPQLIVGAVRDITAQRQAEAEIRALNAELGVRVEERTAELERANQNLEAFTYSVSHDLRAPLRALSGFSEALLEEYSNRLDETGREYAQRIQAASERMAALIDDLLHLSRVSRAEVNLRPVDLSAEATAIAAELRTSEPGRTVRIEVAGGVSVIADRLLIRSVVQNLFENAWKFTGRRDDAVIEFGTAHAKDNEVCYFVRDNGVGFDPAYASKLFKPFQRLHAANDFPGTGIGLASVRRIVERHGGHAWAVGAVGTGATFYFTLGGRPPAAP